MSLLMRAWPLLLFLLLVASLGCSPSMGRVHGSVVLDDKPLAGATVTFFAENQQTYSVTSGPDGRYDLSGVPQGVLKVTVQLPPPRPAPRPAPASGFKGDATADDQAKVARLPSTPPMPTGPLLPPRYGDPESSGLSFVLSGAEGVYDIPLNSRP